MKDYLQARRDLLPRTSGEFRPNHFVLFVIFVLGTFGN